MTLANRLRDALNEGHRKDDPPYGLQLRDSHVDTSAVLSPAAVLVAITDRPNPGLILTERSPNLRKHPGQVAFPGGRVDETDKDEIAGALREAQEELSLPPEEVEVVGTSDRYQTFTGFDIIPVLGVVRPGLNLTPHPNEVASWFELPLDYALNPANHTRKSVMFEGKERSYLEIMWGEHRIWGVTAAILGNLSYRIGYDYKIT